MHRYDDPKFRFNYEKIMEMTETCKQWGKWGPDDEWGTINYIGDEERKEAAKLVKTGKVFSLGLNFDDQGPQRGIFGGRWNPIHTMLATGTDAVQGIQAPPLGKSIRTNMLTTRYRYRFSAAHNGTPLDMSSTRAKCGMVTKQRWLHPMALKKTQCTKCVIVWSVGVSF